MRNSLRLSLATLVLAASSSVFAHTTVSNAWARATVAQQQATGIFLDLKSGHDKAQLVSVSTDIAASAELHEMRMDNNVMKMNAVKSIDLPNGEVVSLKPGAHHIMLMGLKKPLAAGDQVPLTLNVVHEDGFKETLSIQVPVRALGAGAPAADHSGHHGGAEHKH